MPVSGVTWLLLPAARWVNLKIALEATWKAWGYGYTGIATRSGPYEVQGGFRVSLGLFMNTEHREHPEGSWFQAKQLNNNRETSLVGHVGNSPMKPPIPALVSPM